MADGLQTLSAKPDIFSSGQRDLLADNLHPKHIKGRSQGGQSLSYIEGWHAIAEANRIFNFGAWERELVEWKETNRDLVDVTKNNRTEKQWRVGYVGRVRITVHGEGGSRSREGIGYGSGFARDNALGEAIESAVKEMETDAMKRALTTFGNQFGLALYDKTRANVGKSKLDEDMQDQEPDAGQRETPEPEATGAGLPPSAPVAPTLTKAKARAEFGALQEGIRNCTSSRELKLWAKDNADGIARQPDDWKDELRTQYADVLHGMEALEYTARAAADAEAALEGAA